MHAIVHAADVQDRDGGALLMASLFGAFPFLIKLYADGGYQGPEFQNAMKRILARVDVEIVKRSDQTTGFVALPKRWIVERTFAWLGRCRRLAKDWECLNHKALAFLRLASIRLMLRKLCNPHDVLGPVCLILGEMGFEPLKPVGEPDAANSRIRFDVRLGGSFAAIVRCTVSEVAKLSRLRVRPGTGSAPGRASRYCGRGRRGPTRWRPSRRRARETDGSRAPA